MKNFFLPILMVFILIGCQSPNYLNVATTTEIASHINLEYERKLFFIDVYLNGRKTKFLVDTGASVSVLDINQSKEFDFICRSMTNRRIVGLNGSILQYSVSNVDLRAKDGKVIPCHLRACDLSQVINKMEEEGIYITGVLGSDFLMNAKATINYENKTLDLNFF